MDSLVNYTGTGEIADLKNILSGYGSVLVAFSGGIDSSFLLKAALDFLGKKRVLAVTSTGPIYPDSELEDARNLAEQLDAPWRVIERNPVKDEEFKSNPKNRCYHCKLGLFQKLTRIASEENLDEVCDGSIRDDLSGHRPGRAAGEKMGIKRPLEAAGLTKREIRNISKSLGLPGWDKPSNSCLATRIPYGSKVTEEKLANIGKAETELRKLGFQGFRVRHHGKVARLELRTRDLEVALENRKEITKQLKGLGFTYVTLDLEGYRTGSLNESAKAKG